MPRPGDRAIQTPAATFGSVVSASEMAASMVLPTFAAIGVLAAGAMDIGALLVVEHVAMLLGMLAAMLLRPDEYRHHAHGHTELAGA